MNNEQNDIRIHSYELRASFLEQKDSFSDSMMQQAKHYFFAWVNSLLHESKQPTFKNMFANENAALITNIKRELSRVFYGQKLDTIEFSIESQKTDFEAYRKESLNDFYFVRNIIFDRLFYSPNDVILVYGQTLTEPELHLIKFESIQDFETEKDSNVLTSVTFETEKGKFTANKVGYYLNDVLLHEHDLGYCPASFIYPSEPSKAKQSSPLSSFVGALKKLQFFKNSKDVADLVAPYPIVTTYQNECDIDGCSGGVLDNGDACKVCEQSAIIGAGSVVLVPKPHDNDPNLLEAVKFITADTNSLEYIGKSTKTKEENLFFSIVGITEEIRKEAMNEAQIQASFDSRENTLRRFASVLESMHKFVIETAAGLRYGKESIESISFSYGFFFFKSELDLTEEAAKNRILESVIPYFDLTTEELTNFKESIPTNELLLRLKYKSLVARFEEENGSLLKFGSLNPTERNKRLRETLLSYINIRTDDTSEQDQQENAVE